MGRGRARLIGAAVLCVMIASTSGIARASTGADVAVTASWVGNGTPKAAVGDTLTYSITLTNLGPEASAGTYLAEANPDALNFVSMTCSDPVFCSYPGGSLAPGTSVTATIVDVVCCFPVGESRITSAGAAVISANDPNLDNNVALVRTKIVGAHGFSFP
jgi:uncharacterized repeat protein (TIGR01451 family)